MQHSLCHFDMFGFRKSKVFRLKSRFSVVKCRAGFEWTKQIWTQINNAKVIYDPVSYDCVFILRFFVPRHRLIPLIYLSSRQNECAPSLLLPPSPFSPRCRKRESFNDFSNFFITLKAFLPLARRVTLLYANKLSFAPTFRTISPGGVRAARRKVRISIIVITPALSIPAVLIANLYTKKRLMKILERFAIS